MNRMRCGVAAGLVAAPFARTQPKTTHGFHGVKIGQGEFQYRVDKLWSQAHGVAIDTRGAEPLVLCTARIRNEFHRFNLEGEHQRTVYLPGAYLSRPPPLFGDLFWDVSR